MLSPAQKVCAKVYADGEFAYILEEREIPLKEMLDGCGDTLFRFLMIELSVDEGCEDMDEAMNRLHRASEDVAKVAAYIETPGFAETL